MKCKWDKGKARRFVRLVDSEHVLHTDSGDKFVVLDAVDVLISSLIGVFYIATAANEPV
ncbi:MAG: hypothetical protein ACSLEL_01135 [Candidatus Malihini olakiniferum]